MGRAAFWAIFSRIHLVTFCLISDTTELRREYTVLGFFLEKRMAVVNNNNIYSKIG
jgi:hypothetical protein